MEFYAGEGRLTKVLRQAMHRGLRFDILDNEQPGHRRSNFMDLTHASGYAFLGVASEPIFKTTRLQPVILQ